MRRTYLAVVFSLGLSPSRLHAQSTDFSKIYVITTTNNSALTTYTPDGHPASLTIALGGCSCNGVAVDASGRILITHNTNTLPTLSYGQDGKPAPNPIPRFGPSAFGIAIGPAGGIFVIAADGRGKGVVGTWTATGKPSLPLVMSGLELAHFTVDMNGKIYVVSQLDRILKIYAADGKDTGITISSGLQVPRAIAIGPDGKIYVANLLNVTSYLPSGQQTNVTLTHQSPSGPDTPTALAVDAAGKIYVGYYGKGGVAIFNPNGSQVTDFPTPRGVTAIALH
jgi:streptogramin lyase